MSKTNITPGDLQNLINNLRSWSSTMDSLRGSMHSAASSMKSSWNDPQYEMFVQKVDLLSKQMKANVDDLAHTAETLKILKTNIEGAQANVRSRLR